MSMEGRAAVAVRAHSPIEDSFATTPLVSRKYRQSRHDHTSFLLGFYEADCIPVPTDPFRGLMPSSRIHPT